MTMDLFETGAAAEPSGETFTVTVDGQPLELTLDQLIEAAKQGLSKVNRAARLQNRAGEVPEGELYAQFLAQYPDIKPEDIPPEVWKQANECGSLLAAYQNYELQKLREELSAQKKNQQNRSSALGSARTDGAPPEIDPIAAALLGKMAG